MSSSVFIESSSIPKSVVTADGGDFEGEIIKSSVDASADSNLVLVYGKNGINFDQRGLEKLIEDKTLASISVIRISSPTPSMEDEEEAEEKQNELLRRQEKGNGSAEDSELSAKNSENEDDDDEQNDNAATDDELRDSAEEEEEAETTVGDDNSIDTDDTAGGTTNEDVNRRAKSKKKSKAAKVQKQLKRRRKRTRPEIVGLTVEQFYPREGANELIKEVLKLSGGSNTRDSGESTNEQSTTDREFQMYVIMNDHCYTPYTSPEQMKAKMDADKYEVEKQAAARKAAATTTNIAQTSTAAAAAAKKKPLKLATQTAENDRPLQSTKGKLEMKSKRLNDVDDFKNDANDAVDDEELHSSSAEAEDDVDTEYSISEESAETDNDRDSDLDFDVNNRKGRKRKVQLMKKTPTVTMSSTTTKQRLSLAHTSGKHQPQTYSKRRPHSQDNIDDARKTNASKSLDSSGRGHNKLQFTPTTKTAASAPLSSSVICMPKQLSAAIAALPPIPRKQPLSSTTGVAPATTFGVAEVKAAIGHSTNPTTTTTKIATVRRGPIVQISTNTHTPTTVTVTSPTTLHRSSQLQTSPQTVKEIVISKVLTSPKGGFTDISALLSQSDQPTVQIAPVTPTSSTSARQHPHSAQITTTPSSKGFMPLGIEAAVKNQLPAQISIQTHQSSSELAAEHDKQLDLIDSIVQDEMQKSGDIIEEAASVNENIPELVKMLESTEKALVESSNKNQTPQLQHSASNFTPNAAVEDIDISNAPLLETPEEDDIPDDLLQHVVELIEDDKTLQEAVEKQVFGEDSSETVGVSVGSGGVVAATTPPPLAPIFQKRQQQKTSNINVLLQPIQQEHPATKSIIQMAISNSPVPSPASAIGSVPVIATQPPSGSFRLAGIHTPKTSPLVRKEPIQIVRGNGRVITLPPIEAPTTRAKRRAQILPTQSGSSISGQTNTSLNISTLNESSLDNSLQSNASFTVTSTGAASSTNVIVPERKLSDSSARRRVSKEGTATATNAATVSKASKRATANAAKSKASAAAAKANAGKNIEGGDAEESQEDDDDPNKLWCICRQPHKNRFMICCDVCEDWFHGTCVNITKAMGLEMENKGIDWTCPKCLKKQEEKSQRKITEMMPVKKTATGALIATTTVAPSTKTTVQQQNEPAIETEATTYFEERSTTITTPSLSSTVSAHADISKKDFAPSLPTIPKKQIIEIKKIQSGQFIPIKNLEKQTPVTVVTSGQKKMFATTPSPTNASSKRVIVQNIQDPKTIQFNKIAGHEKSSPLTQGPTQSKLQRTTSQPAPHTTPCITCKKASRPNSIYCGDDCIRKHAQNSLNAFAAASSAKSPEPVPLNATQAKNAAEDKKKKAKGLFEDLLSMADRKPKADRVNVFERKTGRVAAPTTYNLKKWLQDNPTFEVVQPGSLQAIEIEKKQKQRALHASSPTVGKGYAPPLFPTSAATTITSLSPTKSTPLTPTQQKFDSGHLSHQQQHMQLEVTSTTVTTTPLQTKNIKQLLDQAKSSPTSSRPNTPKQLQKYPQQVTIKPADAKHLKQETEPKSKDKTTTLRRQGSEGGSGNKKSVEVSSGGQTDSEPIRLNVRRTLKEQLLQRIDEQTATESATTNSADNGANQLPKLTADEVEEFVMETEAEMYNYFNRDTGTKYKSKYRSLMFNIKDRKNHTLFAKISAKLIEPKQLVKMSPEELASQELAQWRENEAKHQLEMIKKSELDLLSCAKNYVLKTHKGEEVIEAKQTDCVSLDLTTPVEDVVSVLNNSTASELELEAASSAQTSSLRKDYGHLSDFGGGTSSPSSSSYLEMSSSSYHHVMSPLVTYQPSSTEEKSKSFGKERERDKEREREKDRDREKQHKSKDRHREKSRSRKRSHSRSRSRSREKRRSSRKDEQRRDRDRDRGEDRGSDRIEKERIKERCEKEEVEKRSEKKIIASAPSSSASTKVTSTTKEKSTPITAAKKAVKSATLESFSLIDQILESSKTVEEAANLVSSTEKEKSNIRQNTPPPPSHPALQPQPQPQSSTQTNSQQTLDAFLALSSVAATIPPPPPPPLTPQSSSTSFSFSTTTEFDLTELPTSTVSISSASSTPTPPPSASSSSLSLDPYTRYNSNSTNGESTSAIWGGNINMIDVASFQIILQSVVGNSLNLGKLLPDELDVVGRIGPDTVWDYISKIKKSPNKEIVIIRLLPSSDSETAAYTILYQYLDKRKRLGVIKTTSGQIKDFYIFPLGAGRNMPTILQPIDRVDFYDDVLRPDMLIGIVIRVIGGKRSTAQSTTASSSTSSVLNSTTTNTASAAKRRVTESNADTLTPPGSPKSKKRLKLPVQKDNEIDLDAIIKAPIAAKSNKPLVTAASTTISAAVAISDDANEPYSPGGSSDDDVPLLPLKASTIMDAHKTTENELKRKMDELNRQIAAQEMEIAGLLNVEPSRYAPSSSSTVLANISIPSNLSQILASIKSKPDQPPMPTQAPPPTGAPPPPVIGSLMQTSGVADDEYNPEDVIGISYDKKKLPEKSSSSRLAQLSEAELLSMVPDNMIEETTSVSSAEKKIRYEQPPPPGV